MKKKLVSAIVIAVSSLVPQAYPQDRADVVEAFTPAPAVLFVKTARLAGFVGTVTFTAGNLLADETAAAIGKKRDDIKTRTGVDILDAESLRRAGIDVGRTASLALYRPGRRGEERALVFLPVLDVKAFPLSFVEFYKRASGAASDLYPVITPYRDHTVYQIGPDVFAVAFDGVCAIGSTGELVREVIDAKENNAGHLSVDPHFADYRARAQGSGDLRAFMTRDFLKEMLKFRRGGGKEKEDKKGPDGKGLESALLRPVAHHAANVGDATVGSELERFAGGPSAFNAVDWASLDASAAPAQVTVDVAVKFNDADPSVNTFRDVLRTGMAGRGLYLRNAATYLFASLDFTRIEELCAKRAAGCGHYAKFKDEIRRELGIDLSADIVPHCTGVMNVVAGQPKGAGGGYCVYMPLNDGQSRKVWGKAAAYCREKYRDTDRFGTTGVKTFWYIDSKNVRVSVSWDARGMYLGNDPGLMSEAMAAREMSGAPGDDAVAKKLGDRVFFLAMVKKESFFGTLLTLFTYRRRELAPLVNAMEELWLIGEKRDSLITLNATVRLKKKK